MNKGYGRFLSSTEAISNFTENVLDKQLTSEECHKILECEEELIKLANKQTINDIDIRKEYIKNEERSKLWSTITEELFNNERLDSDDNINLGNGGAKPKEPKKDRKAIVLIGPPAAGKSTIATKFADHYGAYIIDSDYAKRKIPEFYLYNVGATIVHEESDSIIFGLPEEENILSLFERCIQESLNLIIPKIGHNNKSVLDLVNFLDELGYEVNLVLVSLDRKETTIRALNRFLTSNRYVPLSLVYDKYSNECVLSFYRIFHNIKCDNSKIRTFGKISTAVPLGELPEILIKKGETPICIFE